MQQAVELIRVTIESVHMWHSIWCAEILSMESTYVTQHPAIHRRNRTSQPSMGEIIDRQLKMFRFIQFITSPRSTKYVEEICFCETGRGFTHDDMKYQWKENPDFSLSPHYPSLIFIHRIN